ncbi:MAG TPA: DEAD/DEAH box helicase, partial [Bacteroidales bacterium]|nr:DEAD/DEAH box helicase [Bacteroidales bacterium]
MTVRAEDDLYKLSNEREIYKDGYIIEEIDASNGSITLSNGNVLYKGTTQGALTDEIMKFQMRKTIEEHLKKELRYKSKGVKVLSLFFIDRVANYRQYDTNGNPKHGKFAIWFEEIYSELISKSIFGSLPRYDLKNIHNGYFSQDKGIFKDTSGETLADNDTYSLIMKDKEKLLNINNPLRFIFSHSALREGWDNPNVFQICTLNETRSEMKKRQEIGRGLRLAVNSEGKRIYDRDINRL